MYRALRVSTGTKCTRTTGTPSKVQTTDAFTEPKSILYQLFTEETRSQQITGN